MRCNGHSDCPGHEDEDGCETYTCPGYYRCRGSRVCLHPNFVCDGVKQCPLHDDEWLCEDPGASTCPERCTCYGLAAFCRDAVGLSVGQLSPQLRFLDGSGSGVTLAQLGPHVMLVHVGLAECGMSELNSSLSSPSSSLPNLRYLDLSRNRLTSIGVLNLKQFPNLRVLILDGNPLTPALVSDLDPVSSLLSLKVLSLSKVPLQEFHADFLMAFPSLISLNLSHSGLDRLSGEGLSLFVKNLVTLDVTGCPLTSFPRDVIRGLSELKEVRSDSYKLCCPATLPVEFNLAR